MLQRVQLMLDAKTKRELEKLARQGEQSMSEIVREILKKGLRKKRGAVKKETGAEALLRWAEKAVEGPGDSEYDKYAYDL